MALLALQRLAINKAGKKEGPGISSGAPFGLYPPPGTGQTWFYWVTAKAMQGARVIGGTPPPVIWLRKTPSVTAQKSRVPVRLATMGVAPVTKEKLIVPPEIPVAWN